MLYPWLNDAWQEFEQRCNSGRMAHACLLSGPPGLGKLEFAREIATTLLCREQGSRACGACRSCQLFVSGAHPDFRFLTFEVNPKNDRIRTELVIEQVRDLNAAMQLTNSISPRKVALICPAEAMNRNTANALLKTLEEPPGEAVLLLVTHDPSRLAATIRSRCQMIPVRLPDEDLAVDWLVNAVHVDVATARAALAASAGGPLRALHLLKQGDIQQFQEVENILAAVGADRAAVADVMDTCSGLDQEDLWAWLSLIAARRLRDRFCAMGATAAPATDAGGARLVQELSLLQSLADHNRRALATALRKDLLLRDWLIQWSRLADQESTATEFGRNV